MSRSHSCSRPIPVDPGGAAWFVVQTKPRAEDQAQQFLHRRAVHTFLPRLLVRRRHGSRRWQALEPLFPGYLFCHFAPVPETVARVQWTPGVRRLLGDDDGPIPIDREIIDYLKARQAIDGYIAAGRPLAPGDRVRFVGGPFALLEGIIERPTTRAERVRVLLSLMGTSVVVEVDEAVLERC
ncbi:MAG: transcription termination/antitermination NusG family protein [Armatimonadota bacterium]|nr:transcription termination/antitermination NusG family protein [Armatimonadota bacterium]